MDRLFDDLAPSDIIIDAPAPCPQWAPHGLDHQSDPPRTERAIAARKMAEWKAQQPDAETLATVCAHGAVLKIETCEEGCEL